MLKAAWVLAKKDIRSFVRDRAALMLNVLVPIALVTVFGWIMAYAFGGGNSGMPKVTLHVIDRDQTGSSASFVDSLTSVDMLRVKPIELDDPTTERLSKLINDGDAHHILIVEQGFDESLKQQETPKLGMLRDPGRSMEDQIVRIGVMQAAMGQLGGQVWVEGLDRLLKEQGMDDSQLKSVRGWMTSIGSTISDFASDSSSVGADESNTDQLKEKGEQDANEQDSDEQDSGESDSGMSANAMMDLMSDLVPVETTDVTPPNRSKNVTYQQAQSVAGMSVMMLLFALTSCGSVLLKEREDGTLRRLFAHPIPRNSILLGKLFFVVLVGLFQMTLLFIYGEWMFRVGLFRDPATLLVLTVTWVATGAAFGMFLASVSRSSKQAEGLSSLLILMMAALGGCWFPLQMMQLPTVLDFVCKSTPTYWAMSGFQGMLWSQLPWHSEKLLTAIGWQWGWTVLLGVAASYLFKRNYCRG